MCVSVHVRVRLVGVTHASGGFGGLSGLNCFWYGSGYISVSLSWVRLGALDAFERG